MKREERREEAGRVSACLFSARRAHGQPGQARDSQDNSADGRTETDSARPVSTRTRLLTSASLVAGEGPCFGKSRAIQMGGQRSQSGRHSKPAQRKTDQNIRVGDRGRAGSDVSLTPGEAARVCASSPAANTDLVTERPKLGESSRA